MAGSTRDTESGQDGFDDTYTESQVILTAVKIIAPFTLTYGTFMALHGADTPGGSFQGGAIIGVTVLMIAFAFGIEPTRQWLRNDVLAVLIAGGVAVFIGVGLVTIGLGGAFLEYRLLETILGIPDGTKWGMEAIEIGGIALIVSGVVITLFFATAAGYIPSSSRLAEYPGLDDRTGAGREIGRQQWSDSTESNVDSTELKSESKAPTSDMVDDAEPETDEED